MYNRIYDELNQNDLLPIKGRVLGISGIQNFFPLIDKDNSDIIDASFPEVNMQELPYNEKSFDFVISDQILEHLENPKLAIQESYRVLKKDGIAVHTTCFLNPIHRCPLDFWRFSPEALSHLCSDFSKILNDGGWGNRIAVIFCLIARRLRFMKIPDTKYSLRHLIATFNEEEYPIVTWVIARK